ncbi:hypothetical protein QBC35DRAFT_13218 [Podospora australis]|uniref:C3H1-type domain-containing protein n=1 Tax=Podospora australis TaxID=1536484 RepID=A0AAN7AMD0_9PEZI|nr:hypothetical protein QBC35DRAFT_13218 [Podospora australis]
MDQSHPHGGGLGGWDPNSFMNGGDWSQSFDPATLGYDHGPAPEFLDAAAINPQLSASNDYQDFGYMPQNHGHGHGGQNDVWQNQAPVPHYSQEHRAPQQYYTEQHFAAPSAHHPSAQDVSHGFQNGMGITNGSVALSNGYPQNSMPHWQGQIPAGYAATNNQFESALHAPGPVSSMSPPAQTASPVPFSMTPYQQEVRPSPRPAPLRPQHDQFHAGLNGQMHHTHVPVSQLPAVAANRPEAHQPVHQQLDRGLDAQPGTFPATGFHNNMLQQSQVPTQSTYSTQPNPSSGQKRASSSDAQATQAVAKKARVVSTPVPAATPVPARTPVSAPLPAPAPAPAPVLAHIPTPGPTSAAAPTPVTAPAHVPNLAAAPSSQHNVRPTVLCSINYIDQDVLQSAQGRDGAFWPAVPNLVVGAEPVTLRKGPHTKRFVHLFSTNPGKAPLFPDIPSGWIQAESFGNHRAVFENASSSEIDKFRADKRLDIEFERGYNQDEDILRDWMRKVYDKFEKSESSRAPLKLLPGPGEPENTGIVAEETIRLHPIHMNNRLLRETIRDSYQKMIGDICTGLKDRLGKLKKDGKSDLHMPELKLLTSLLERVLLAGSQHPAPDFLFDFATSGFKYSSAAFNALVRAVNVSRNEPYMKHIIKVILRLFTYISKMTPGFLRKIKMKNVYTLLVEKEKGDEEMKELLTRIYEIAKNNAGDDSSDEEDSSSSSDPQGGVKGGGAAARQKESAGSASTGKKTSTPAAAKGENKQSNLAADSKKVTPPLSSSKPTKLTSDTKKLPANTGLSTKAMAPGSDPKKATAKEVSKTSLSSSSSSGTKRSRDDDAGNDVRSAKKPATAAGTASATGTKGASVSLSSAGKSPATRVTTVVAKPASGSTPSVLGAASSKSRPSLLPGKARLTTKATPSSLEPLKSQAVQKSGPVKSESAQSTKTATSSSSAAATKPSKSAFSALMDEINDGDGKKKIITSTVSVKKEREIPENETAEEKDRRLRKEKRRALGLKVAFKMGDALVEIREFTREPEEIDSQNKSVGASNKHNEAEHFRIVNSKMGIKDQEIAGRDWEALIAINFSSIPKEKREETFETRGGLKVVNTPEQKAIEEHDRNELLVIYHHLSDVPPTPRSPTYEPSFDNTASEIQLPPTVPDYDEIKRRNWEHRSWGPRQASHAAQARLDTKSRPDFARFAQAMESINSIADANARSQAPTQAPTQAQNPAPTMDARVWFDPATAAQRDQVTFALLTTDSVKNWKDNGQNPYPSKPVEALSKEVRDVLDNLTAICKEVEAGRTQQQEPVQSAAVVQPQVAALVPPPVAASVQPILPAQTATPPQNVATDHAAAWALYYQQQQQHQAYYAQLQAAQAQQPQQQAPDLAAILAQLGPQQPTAPPAQHPAQVQAIMAALAGNIGNQAPAGFAVPPPPPPAAYQQQPAYGPAENPHQPQSYAQPNQDPYASMYDEPAYVPSQQNNHQERDGHNGYGRDRDANRDRDRDRDGRDRPYHMRGGNGGSHKRRGGNDKNGGNKEDVPDHLRGINQRLIGTKQCAFWAKGTCAKGDKCTFRHG